jgi:Flp pilus assembly protein TadG
MLAQKWARDNSGAAAVEFAMIVPLLLLMVLGVTELGKIVYYRSVLESAARAGTQAAFGAAMTTSAQITAAQTTMETSADLAITNSGIGGTVTSTATIICLCSSDVTDTVDCATGSCTGGASKRYYATVTMTRAYTPLYNLTNLPFGYNIDLSMTLTGSSELWVK